MNRAQFLGAGALALAATACAGSGAGSASSVSPTSAAPSLEPELHLANWPDYVNPVDLKEFSDRNGVRLVPSAYVSNEQLLDDLAAAHGSHRYDVIVPDADHVNIEKGLGLLMELDHDQIPNLKHLDPRWTKLSYDPGNRYSVIKDTGITTFAWRSDKITQKLHSWKDFFSFLPHAEPLSVNFIESPSEVIGLALLALGHSMNSDDDDQLAAARELLLDVRPFVTSLSENSVRAFEAGDVDLGIIYSGDALRVQQTRAAQADIAIARPEKSELWIDSWAIASGAPDPNAAHAFINYMLSPEVNAREMEYTRYEVGTPASFPIVRPASLAKDPLVVFPGDVLSGYEVLRTTPVGLQKRLAIWQDFVAA